MLRPVICLVLFIASPSSSSSSSSAAARSWLQFVHHFQSQLTLNTSLPDVPTCSTWISNNYQTTPSLNRTLQNLERWGQHCVSKVDCIRGSISFQNQDLTLTEQLDSGVRRLVLELHYVSKYRERLRLCASVQNECVAMKRSLKVRVNSRRSKKYNWCRKFSLRANGVHTGCHKGSPVFRDTVRELIRWINRNQDAFLIIDLIDFVSMETDCSILPELHALLRLFGGRLLKPSEIKNATSFPSLGELREAGKNLLVRSTCTFGGALIFPALASDYVNVNSVMGGGGGGGGKGAHCTPTQQPFTLYYHDKIHVDLILREGSSLRLYRSTRQPTRALAQRAATCGSPVALQATSHTDLFSCSWTWLPHHTPNNCTNRCTAFHYDPRTHGYGWENTNCTKQLHLACRARTGGQFTVSPHYRPIPNSGQGDEFCGAGHTFEIPTNPREAWQLSRQMWHHGLSYVWLPRSPQLTCTDTVSYIDCGRPEVPENGRVLTESHWFDATARYSCLEGWDLIGTEERTCQSNGTWSGTVPYCKRVECGPPPHPLQTRIEGTTTDYGSAFIYTCRWGHVFEGEAATFYMITRCAQDGRWDTFVPNCIQRQCEVGPWSSWSGCSQSCREGYQTRTRQILSRPEDSARNCPVLRERRKCAAQSCDTCTSRSYSRIIQVASCNSEERVTNRFCKGSCPGEGMCCRATETSIKRVDLYCEDSRPRQYSVTITEECGCVQCEAER